MRRAAFLCLALVLGACGFETGGAGEDEPLDSGTGDDGVGDATFDASKPDTTVLFDTDDDVGATDAVRDSVVVDSGVSDTRDSAVIDSGPLDTGIVDSGPLDTGVIDSGPLETGVIDSGTDTRLDAPTDTAPSCTETGAVMFGGHCYFYLSATKSWNDAKAACESASPGAHMVTITSAAEDAVVKAFTTADVWIGLSRDVVSLLAKASFKWITTEAQSYDGWRTGEPNGSGLCARETSSGWRDEACDQLYGVVCERE
jgi:hypothetical protein